MTPQQVIQHLEKHGIPRKDFADRLGVTEQALSFWLHKGWIVHERQCQIELELRGKLRASWDDIPKDKRPTRRAERAA